MQEQEERLQERLQERMQALDDRSRLTHELEKTKSMLEETLADKVIIAAHMRFSPEKVT